MLILVLLIFLLLGGGGGYHYYGPVGGISIGAFFLIILVAMALLGRL